MPSGTYKIRVAAPGVSTSEADNVILRVAQTLTINLTLEIGEVSEQVTVSDKPPLLESGTAEIGQPITLTQSAPGAARPVVQAIVDSWTFPIKFSLAAKSDGPPPKTYCIGDFPTGYYTQRSLYWATTFMFAGGVLLELHPAAVITLI
jgi:hypothetical protein